MLNHRLTIGTAQGMVSIPFQRTSPTIHFNRVWSHPTWERQTALPEEGSHGSQHDDGPAHDGHANDGHADGRGGAVDEHDDDAPLYDEDGKVRRGHEDH